MLEMKMLSTSTMVSLITKLVYRVSCLCSMQYFPSILEQVHFTIRLWAASDKRTRPIDFWCVGLLMISSSMWWCVRSALRSCIVCGIYCWSDSRRRVSNCNRPCVWSNSCVNATRSCSGSVTKKHSSRRTNSDRTWNTSRCCRRSSTSSRRISSTKKIVSMTSTYRLTNSLRTNTPKRRLFGSDAWSVDLQIDLFDVSA